MRSNRTRSVFSTLITTFVLAAAAALLFVPEPAHAHAAFYAKKVNLQFVRNSNAADNPFVAANPAQTQYVVTLSNGTHGTLAPTAGASVTPANQSLAATDTSAGIDVREHWLKSKSAYVTAPPTGSTSLLADSLAFGTLTLTSNSATIDTILVLRDVSNDGITWSVVDSVGAHIICDAAQIVTGAVSDSAEFVMTSVSSSAGAAGFKLGMTFTANPWFSRAGVTAQALLGVNFVRFRYHMTYTDYVAAGASRGVVGDFVFPAVDSNPNLPARAVPSSAN